MNYTPTTADAVTLVRARWALMIAFLVNGAIFANWAPRIPLIQGNLGIDPALLGLALAGLGIGGLLLTPIAAAAIGRFGSRQVLLVSVIALCGSLILPAIAPTWWALLATLVLLGGSDAVMDVAMNTQGVLLEKRTHRSLLNGFHAAWSVGTVVGGLAGTAAASIGMPVAAHFAAVSVILGSSALVASRWFPRPAPSEENNHDKQDPGTPRTIFGPSAALSLLGLIVLFAALIEDVPQSWSAVYLSSELEASSGTAGLAFVAFSTAMLIGRLISDRLVDRWGASNILIVGGVFVACAFGASIAIVTPITAIIAFAVAGLGASPIFPIAFSLAGRLPKIASGTAIGTISMVSRIGFLIAPLAVGATASAFSFGLAFTLIALSGLAVAALTATLKPRLS
ncbi:MFS transporter [Rhodococcus sp. H29-C3]|uniref:MFS transporter n=1 Tax=Rhodococcus sp. H29-C3 TaxID=3046307 RepID=UPI0024B8BE84|nr:MFS transporter [Rhodococcus sp. H29-C3]MDJ0363330.1 MFS transporter [Rhodococcus sp. H29-C3]